MDNSRFINEITEYKNQMYMVALSLLKNHADAEDIVQEAIITAYEGLNTLKNDDSFKSWMMRIVVNQAKMYIRKNSRIVCSEEIHETSGYAGAHKDIWDIVLSLKDELSTVVILFYKYEYSIKEIAKILGIPMGTVKSRLSGARKILKKKLEDCI